MKTNLRSLQTLTLFLTSLCFLASPGLTHGQTPNINFKLLTPGNGESFFAPTNIQINAILYEDYGSNVVTFYAGTNVLDVVTNGGPWIIGGPIFGRIIGFDWSNVPAGSYAISAKSVWIAPTNHPTEWTQTNTITVLAPHYLAATIVQPTNGTIYSGPTNISLLAGGNDTNGAVAFVEFFDGRQGIGFVTNGVVLDPLPPPNEFPPGWQSGDLAYFLDWTNQSIGTHYLTAAIVDTNGQIAYSPPLTVVIGSNIPPNVRIVSPPNNAVFYAPVNVGLVAFAGSPDGQVANVEFFNGTNDLGAGQPFQPPVAIPLGGGAPPPSGPAALTFYLLTWTNPPTGTFALTAVATDSYGSSSTSSVVNISVLPSVTPPPTNFPDIVGVIATDPIAVASTNCWFWRAVTNNPGSWTNWVSPVAHWEWFTNCGPKDATFTVHRFGDTTSNLLVNYTLAGTATNGADYMTLPGFITIPAGQNTAAVTVVPIENGSNYVRTVLLTLDSSTNTPPAYLLGFGSKAEALITSHGLFALPQAGLLGGGGFHFSLNGPDGAWFHVDYSTNLINWIPLCTNQVVDGSINFVDPNASSSPSRIYRTVPMSGPPGN